MCSTTLVPLVYMPTLIHVPAAAEYLGAIVPPPPIVFIKVLYTEHRTATKLLEGGLNQGCPKMGH